MLEDQLQGSLGDFVEENDIWVHFHMIDYPTIYKIILNITTNITTKNETIELVLRYFATLSVFI